MRIVSGGVPIEVLGKQGPRGMAGPDGNPIGVVISYMGKTPPKDYLICNGETHLIADYPKLADFFEEQFGEKNYFGGNGITDFAVPTISGSGDMISCIKATEAGPYEDIYSTVETICGRWVDGKPIYKKCINVTVRSTSETFIPVGADVDFIVNARAIIEDASPKRYLLIPGDSTNITLYNDNTIRLFNTYSGTNGRNGVLIVEYTKLADAASI